MSITNVNLTKNEVINETLTKGFDTPKKLNRSTKPIPVNIIESLENGEFTYESIQDLSVDYPIYRYKTCLTIHGDWGTVKRNRIGGYKNIHQNGNGSLEVRWNAIDSNKFKEMNEMFKLAPNHKKFNFILDSQNRLYRMYKSLDTTNIKESILKEKETFLNLEKKISEIDFLGNTSIYVANLGWYGVFMVMDLNIKTLPQNSVKKMALTMLNLTEEEFTTIADETKKKIEADKAESIRIQNEAREKRNQYLLMVKGAVEEKGKVLIDLPNASQNDLKKNNVLVGCFYTDQSNYTYTFEPSNVKFKYIRIDGNGSFGRIKMSVAYSETFVTMSELNTLTFKEMKQLKSSEFKTDKYKVLNNIQQRMDDNTKVVNDNSNNVRNITIVDYSEKAIAVIGDTYSIKDKLKELGGVFNYRLKCGAGWIFNKTKRNELQTLLAI
jgi:hypothetical protein